MENYKTLREKVGIDGELSRERMMRIVNSVFRRSAEGHVLRFYYGLDNGVPINNYVKLGRMFREKPRKIRNMHKEGLRILTSNVLDE